MSVETITVALGPDSYDILIGRAVLADAGRHIAPVLKRPVVHIVTDSNVAPLYLDTLQDGLRARSIVCHASVVPAGEDAKCFSRLERLLDEMLARGVERADTVVALGGGVVGDLAGFAASIVLRGIDYIQIPTTLLAQVDSSVGGKTAINSAAGKNLVGRFHQPRLVLIDIDCLDSLPPRAVRAGYAEIVKYGLVYDAAFFDWLDASGGDLLDGAADARTHAVRRSCAIKAEIVAGDEFEHGRRALLNLGHTFAHAFEAAAGYDSGLMHGEAVAVGLVLAADLSARSRGLAPEQCSRVRSHLAALKLPVSPGEIGLATASPDQLIGLMQRDKKVQDGRPKFIVMPEIGSGCVAHDIALDTVRSVLNNALTGR